MMLAKPGPGVSHMTCFSCIGQNIDVYPADSLIILFEKLLKKELQENKKP